ncbi:acetate kinase [Stutzerimonas kirkiae]|uniref:Acetate kinase n=1 Tax=Stutzerimonas kirkiae TaxID=2211392 RepID=A0A4Q9R606_9GAMM|nr:acetate kinase [Stutzerimonas kirkiae]TBU94561.1 propionate/acetate kinase [Stutzerimonas kirkiae]TBU99099.1 propionate/acetate kinase [Stutzerimonas kirkiae]TBV03599.1 propionate/acetate kinase [Stutzerimonas kirkiae]TBV09852.1 propionate/acetate kinase [Stutzerimonas kirkiae]
MPARNILVINCGSSSIKFALVNEEQAAFPLQGLAERLGSPEAVLHWQLGEAKESLDIPHADHRAALERLLPLAQEAAGGHLDGIGHRVVHGGEHFTGSTLIDDAVLDAVRTAAQLAPLHNPANLTGIEAAMALFPGLPQVSVFDTAFHQTMPEYAYRYAVPEFLYREHGVRRYGFHGTSHLYVSKRAAELTGLPVNDSCWLTAHLGNGSSTCAIVNGESRDTSMGLTPLEGLAMGTRSGDVDPNLHNYLARNLGWTLDQVDRMLNHESGLKGLSGLSNDMRTLYEARIAGHAGASLAFEVFCYRLAKSLAGMACALPRLDGLVFTGGIGENSSAIRARTLEHLKLFNFKLDDEANARCIRGVAGEIQATGSPRVMVVPTNEERQIAIDTLTLLDA